MTDNAEEAQSLSITLSKTNPEVYSAVPRRGGYISNEEDPLTGKTCYRKDNICNEVAQPDSSKLCKATNTNDINDINDISSDLLNDLINNSLYNANKSCFVNYSDSFLPNDEDTSSHNNPKNESSQMLSITISCVMMLASGVQDISPSYLAVAGNYLSCMKDDNGYYPPNIEAILGKICALSREDFTKSGEDKIEGNVERKISVCDRKLEFE